MACRRGKRRRRKAAGGFINARRQADSLTQGGRRKLRGCGGGTRPVLGRKRRQWVGWCGGYGDDFRPSTGSVCGGRVGGASPLGGTGGGMRENRWRRRMGWPARRERRGGKGGGAGEDKCGGRKRGRPASPRRAGHPMQCGGGGMRGYDGVVENGGDCETAEGRAVNGASNAPGTRPTGGPKAHSAGTRTRRRPTHGDTRQPHAGGKPQAQGEETIVPPLWGRRGGMSR